MALIDKQNVLSDAQAPTTGTTVSTNTIDTGDPGTLPHVGDTPDNDISRGNPLEVIVQVVTAATSANSTAKVQVQVIDSAAANLGSPTVLASSDEILVTSLTAGYRFRVGIPKPIGQRYLGVQYVVTVENLTAGAFDAWIAPAGSVQDRNL